MKVLVDKEIRELLTCENPIIICSKSEDISFVDSQIQPCSFDFTISEVCEAPSDAVSPEQYDTKTTKRSQRFVLGVGECARVFTSEKVNFCEENSCYFGMLSSPARIARRGVVVLDVTTIDPGFFGELSFTVINFGGHPFILEAGMTIATAVIGKLDEPVEKPLLTRTGEQPYDGRFKAIAYLAPDLLGLTRRAEEAAKRSATEVAEKLKSNFWMTLGLPALVSALFVSFTMFGSYIALFQENAVDYIVYEQRVEELESRLHTLERRFDQTSAE